MASAKKARNNSPEIAITATLQNLNKVLMESVDSLAIIRGDLRKISGSFRQHFENIQGINTLLKPIVDGGVLERFKNALEKTTTTTPAARGSAGQARDSRAEADAEERREVTDDLTESEEQLYFEISNQIRILTTLNQAFTSFSQGINTLIPTLDMISMIKAPVQQATNAIASLPSQIDSLRQNLLGMGTSLENFDVQFGSQIENLVGDKFRNLENAANLFSQGFRGNNRGLLAVANKMDLTGQRTSLLTDEFSRLSVLMQLSNVQMNNLALNLDKTSQTFGVKTDQLIQVLGKLKNLEVMSTLGFGGEFANNLKDLAAKYKMGEDQMIKLVNALTDPRAFQGLAKADPAIISLVQKLEQATNPAQFEEVFKDIVMRLDSFASSLAQQAKGSGLPATVMASQLFGMFGQDLNTASQLAKVFTERLSESQVQLLKETEFTQSLNASIQELKTEVGPVIKALTDFGIFIIKSNGLYPIFTAAVVKLLASFASTITESIILAASVRRSESALNQLATATNRATTAMNAAAGSSGGGGLGGGSFLNRFLNNPMMSKVLGLIPFVGTIATAASFLPMALSFFSQDKEKDSTNLQQIASNTTKMADQASKVKDIPQQDSLYSIMARDMAYVIASRDEFNERMLSILSDQKRDTAKLDQLVQIGAQQLRAQIDSGKVFRRY